MQIYIDKGKCRRRFNRRLTGSMNLIGKGNIKKSCCGEKERPLWFTVSLHNGRQINPPRLVQQYLNRNVSFSRFFQLNFLSCCLLTMANTLVVSEYDIAVVCDFLIQGQKSRYESTATELNEKRVGYHLEISII